MLVVPIVIMTFFRDRVVRYLLPMFAPAAVITARGLLDWLEHWRDPMPAHRMGLFAHAIVLAGLAAFPLAGMTQLLGERWFSASVAIPVTAASAVVLIIGLLLARRWRWAIPFTTAILMLVTQAVFAYGYGRSEKGHSETRPLVEQIRRQYPLAAVLALTPGRRPPPDLSIYLNREVTTTTDPSAIPRANRTQVLIVLQRRNEKPPVVPPPWREFSALQLDRRTWRAYVKEPEQ